MKKHTKNASKIRKDENFKNSLNVLSWFKVGLEPKVGGGDKSAESQ